MQSEIFFSFSSFNKENIMIKKILLCIIWIFIILISKYFSYLKQWKLYQSNTLQNISL